MAFYINSLILGCLILATIQRCHMLPFIELNSEQLFEDDGTTNDVEEVVAIDEEAYLAADPNLIDLSSYAPDIFGLPDKNKTARLVAEYNATSANVNPEELGSYLEGDILIPQAGSIILKNGIPSKSSRWPQGIIPYVISGKFERVDLEIINYAVVEYHRKTCIRFVPRTTQTDYISITNDKSGCWSSVGRVGGKQQVNLQTPGCLTKPGTPMHELMHVLGFLHEQNREERDAFVEIQYKNINDGARVNFKKVSKTSAFGVGYDYASVMHYSNMAFSRNGKPTIMAMQPEGNDVMGQRDGFSDMDLEKINRMYNCKDNGDHAKLPDNPAPARPYFGNSFFNKLLNNLFG